MNLSLWIVIPGLYALTAVAMWRWLFRWMISDDPIHGWGDLSGTAAVATIGVAIWGLWVLPALIRRASHDDPQAVAALLAGESRAQKRKRMAERIAQLEEELELR